MSRSRLGQLFVVFSLFLFVVVAENADPDVGRDMVTIVKTKGYPIEQHFVQTRDGYILGVYRIPNGRKLEAINNNQTITAKPVVLLQHGLLDSSYTWVNNFPDQSLGFILADAGFDVWLGNNRGNTWSKRHARFDPNSEEFWDFTWDEMAKYDVPDTIEFILKETGASQLSYIGHSQGTTQAFASFSTYKQVEEKVKIFIALAPVATVKNQGSLLLKLLAALDAGKWLNFFGFKEFLPDETILQKIAPGICDWVPYGCQDFLFLIAGGSEHMNQSRIQVYVSETPAGTSVKNVIQWTQGVKSGVFKMYDYGCGLLSCPNQDHYGQKTPPIYNVTQIRIPTALYYGGQDLLTNRQDLEYLFQNLANIESKNEVPTYAHLDFTWGTTANQLVYQSVLRKLLSFV